MTSKENTAAVFGGFAPAQSVHAELPVVVFRIEGTAACLTYIVFDS